MESYVLALDQGTSSSRALLFDHAGRSRAMEQCELPQILPAPGMVEHAPHVIFDTLLQVAQRLLEKSGVKASQIAAIGITNQRETTILWDRATGEPEANAIVWQSRVSEPICRQWREQGLAEEIRRRTGLEVDAYFSASKIRHLLDTIPGLEARARRGEIAFGTVDSWLLWRLTGGQVHATDVSNASRTMMFNIHTLSWDAELLAAMQIPAEILPAVKETSHLFGAAQSRFFGREIPIAAMVGDQQAATFGQLCFQPGDVKCTYGTGCFALLNTGNQPVVSKHRLLTTVGWKLAGQTTYCVEGAVFIAGAAVQWLRDGLGIIRSSVEMESLASTVAETDGVMFVPAFVGLSSPYWNAHARGMICGISRGTTAGHLARATLEAIALQTNDLLQAMSEDIKQPVNTLKVDGGAISNNLLAQLQADLANVTVIRPTELETTARGAAFLAGLAVGYWPDQKTLARMASAHDSFVPVKDPAWRANKHAAWHKAIHAVQQLAE